MADTTFLNLSPEEMREAVKESVDYKILNKLFAVALSELRQDAIGVRDDENIDTRTLSQVLPSNGIFVTNWEYRSKKRDFQVIDHSGEIILTISPDGNLINGLNCEDYQDNSQEQSKLVMLLEKLADEMPTVFTPTAQ